MLTAAAGRAPREPLLAVLAVPARTGWHKDTATYDDNINNTSDTGTSHGGSYQILLGSKILLTSDFFVDLRIQNKHYRTRTLSSSSTGVLNGVTGKEYDTVDAVLLIGRAL